MRLLQILVAVDGEEEFGDRQEEHDAEEDTWNSSALLLYLA